MIDIAQFDSRVWPAFIPRLCFCRSLRQKQVLHLASFCLADAELHLEGADDSAFAALKLRYADVLGGAPAGMPPDRGMELELDRKSVV